MTKIFCAISGTFKFDRIGSPYPDWVPIFGMRFVPALMGSILPSFSYILCREIGISAKFAVLSALLIILGKYINVFFYWGD